MSCAECLHYEQLPALPFSGLCDFWPSLIGGAARAQVKVSANGRCPHWEKGEANHGHYLQAVGFQERRAGNP